MEDLILKMIDIENQAQTIISDARAANTNLDKDIANETKILHENIVNRVNARSEAIKAEEIKEAEEKCEKIRAKSKQQIETLKQKYAKNKDAWVEGIVNNIVNS